MRRLIVRVVLTCAAALLPTPAVWASTFSYGPSESPHGEREDRGHALHGERRSARRFADGHDELLRQGELPPRRRR